jgi:hypothetical protein
LDLVGPHIKNRLTGSVTVNGATDQVHLPTAELDWTVAARFEFGYRLAQGSGELLLSYRFLTTSGSDTIAAFDAAGNPGALHSRLNLNVIDLDYGSRETPGNLGPNLDWKWKVGVRLASVFFDSRAESAALEKRTSNDYFGAGPHAGLDLWHYFEGTGLALFGRIETAFLIGRVHQSYEEVFTAADGTQTGGTTRLRHAQPVPVLALQAGVTWSPPGSQHLRFTAGYTFEDWWNVGEIDPSAHGEVMVQGVFLRGEWRY